MRIAIAGKTQSRKYSGFQVDCPNSYMHAQWYTITMPLSYTVDFRWRVVWLRIALGMSVIEVARQMCISE